MANSKFFYFNYVVQPETQITASSGGEDPFYPLTNLKHPQAVKTFRSNAGATTVLVFDFQTPVTVDSFLTVGSALNSFDLASATIEANALDSWTSPAFSQAVTDIDYEANFASCLFTAQTYRYWRLTMRSNGSYIEVSKLFLGSSVSLTSNNISIGFEHGSTDLSTVVKGRYGQRFIDSITDVKTFKGSIGLMTTSEQDIIRAMYDYCGKSIPVWLVTDPGQTFIANKDVLSGYFYFTERPTFTNDFFGLYSTQFALEEAK
jgi:hypothetical protein